MAFFVLSYNIKHFNYILGGCPIMFKKNSDVHALIMEQIKDVEKCLVAFEQFMRAATTKEVKVETLKPLRDGVCEAENVADISLRAMIDSLASGSYLPSTREDLINIATSCDKIANKCEGVAQLIVLYKFSFPEKFNAEFNEIFDITEKQFELLEKSIDMLFSKMNTLQKDTSILDEIRSLESQIDKLEQKISESIFDSDIELAAKMQFVTIVERLCDISDIIEDIADKIQIMLIARKA